MTTDMNEVGVMLAKAHGRITYLEDRVNFFQEMVRRTQDSQERVEAELAEAKSDLKQANILADRYRDLMCTIVELAQGREDLPIDVALVVQEAQAVVRCTPNA